MGVSIKILQESILVYTMKNLLLPIFVFFTSFVISQCTHTIKLTDTFGDGWNGGAAVSVSVNGTVVLTNITLSTGYGPVNYNFTATSGQTIRVYRTIAGTYPSEMRVQVVNNVGTVLLATVQPVAGTSTTLGSTCVASCGVVTAGCTNVSSYGSVVAPTTSSTVTISTCNYQSEYSTITGITSGKTYQLGYAVGGIQNGYITVHTGTYNGPIVTYGNAPLNWSSTYVGTVYVHYNTNSSCGTASSCGTSTITCVTCSAPTPPPNDVVCSATSLSCGQTLSGTTVNATNSGTGENGVCSVTQTNPGVWYVIPGNGQIMTASLCGTAWDSKISVFSGPNCSSLTCVGGNDDYGPACSSSSASFTWTSVVGTNYYMLIHGYSLESAFTINISCVTPPPTDPTSISATQNTICNGLSTTLTANGGLGMVYWYSSGCGGLLEGTGNTITVSPTTTTSYYVKNYNNGQFSVGCALTTITVNPNPTVTISSATNTICDGSNTQLISNVSGLPSSSVITYLWTPSIGLTNTGDPSPYVSPTTNQTYTLTVTSNGCSNSNQSTIIVNPSVGFVSTISGNNTIIAGTQESYSITPTPNTNYQWDYTESITSPLWVFIPNSNSPSITFTWPQTTTNGSARVIVSNNYGCGTQTRFFDIITNGALPVELLSFVGECDNNLISLNWKTASEHNSNYFEVLKSRDGLTWSILTTLNSAGNSTQELTYTTKDENIIDGNNYYKLIQYDIDGQSKEYGPINVMCNENTKGYFLIFPNPSSGSFQAVLDNKNMIGDGKLIIKDTKGSEILNKKINIVSGINLYNVGDLNIVDGVYYVQISNENFSTQIIKQIIK